MIVNVLLQWDQDLRAIQDAAQFVKYQVAIKDDQGVVVATALEPDDQVTFEFIGLDLKAGATYEASVVLAKIDGSLDNNVAAAKFTIPAAPTAPVPVNLKVSLV